MPDWDSRHARGEIHRDRPRLQSSKSHVDSRELKDDNNELQGVDVDISGRIGGEVLDAMEGSGAPAKAKPEPENHAIGSSTSEARIASGIEVARSGGDHSNRYLPRVLRRLQVREEVADRRQDEPIDLKPRASRPNELGLLALNQAVDPVT